MKNFENFLNEKMGINDDVMKITDFVYEKVLKKNKEDYKKTGKLFFHNNSFSVEEILVYNRPGSNMPIPPNGKRISTTEEIPETKYNIDSIVLDFGKLTHFSNSYSKKIDNRYQIYIGFNLEYMNKCDSVKLKGMVGHEINHAIDWIIKNRMTIDMKIDYKKLINHQKIYPELTRMLYYSDEREIKSNIHEFYISFKNHLYPHGLRKDATLQDAINYCNSEKYHNRPSFFFNIANQLINYRIDENFTKPSILNGKYKELEKVIKELYNMSLEKLQKYINNTGLEYKKKLIRTISKIILERDENI